MKLSSEKETLTRENKKTKKAAATESYEASEGVLLVLKIVYGRLKRINAFTVIFIFVQSCQMAMYGRSKRFNLNGSLLTDLSILI